MKEKLKDFIDALFANAPKSQAARDTKEEFFRNACDKYDDFIAQGKDETTAFNLTIAGIGDVSEVLRSLNTAAPVYDDELNSENTKKSKKHVAIVGSVIWLLATFIYLAISFATGTWHLTWIMFIATEAVQSFANAVAFTGKKRRNAISGGIWCTIVTLYFIISFTTGAWHVTWIIFLLGAAVSNIIKAIMSD